MFQGFKYKVGTSNELDLNINFKQKKRDERPFLETILDFAEQPDTDLIKPLFLEEDEMIR
jgi:hypothetical protein